MKYRKLLFALCLLIGIAVSIKSFREPDLWWQIRTGEWILEHHEVPKVDVFSYTMNGTEWINIKWGFEVLAAFVADHLGPESVFILQAIINCLMIFFLFRLSDLFFRQQKAEVIKTQNRFLFSGMLTFLIVIIGAEYRMIGRPEMISHLMTIVFLYLLEKNRQIPSRQLYLLIPLQMLWANMHEAFGIGIVILLIYTLSEWFKVILSKEKKTNAVQLSLATLGAIVSVIVNPNGIKLLARPFNIMSQVYSNKYTTELHDITASDWWQKEAYIALLISLVSIIFIFLLNGNTKGKQKNPPNLLTRLNDPFLIVIAAFLYLGLSAYRNLVFLTLICFPVFHFSLFSFLQKWFTKFKSFEKIAPIAAIVMLIIFYAGIVSDQYYKRTNSRDRFGLEVLSVNNPTGAADYILQHNLLGKKCFSDYLTSSYLMWKLQPEFKTFIDLRDLDIFPPAFFDRFMKAVNSPADYFQLDSVEHFDYAVVFRPQFDQLHNYLFNDSVYALKYIDAVAAIYEKTDDFSREDIFSPCKAVKAGGFAMAINKILDPFYKPYNYASIENDYITANYYLNVGRVELAKQRADHLAANSKTRYKASELMGQIYFRSAMQEPVDSAKSELLNRAEESYMQSLRENKGYAPSFLGLGVVHYSQQKYTAAISNLNNCLAFDHDNYQAHIAIAQCYREMLATAGSKKDDYTIELLNHYLQANTLNPGNAMVLANIGFIYFQMNDCEHAKPFLAEVSKSIGLGKADSLAVQNCLRQCGY
ncbi:MAG: hypothetical protein ABI763_07370 [Bacteroidota bacterium]